MAKDSTDAKILVELGGVLYDYEALTDSGDHLTFQVATAGRLFSMLAAQKPLIRPDGILTGLEVTPAASGTDDLVDVSAGTAWINGALVTLAAADVDVAVARATPADTHKISSLTLTSAGAVAVVAGVDHTAFSETRAADGGPPLIPVTSIELAQARLTGTAAAVLDSEIFAVPNQHRELAAYPVYEVKPMGSAGRAQVVFSEALPLIHTGAIAKKVYARYTNPSFATLTECSEVKLPRDTASQSEDATYDGPRAAVKWGRGTGSVTHLHDGSGTALIMQVKGAQRFLKFYPDKYLTGYWIMLATLGVADEYPVGGNMRASISLGAQAEPVWIQP